MKCNCKHYISANTAKGIEITEQFLQRVHTMPPYLIRKLFAKEYGVEELIAESEVE